MTNTYAPTVPTTKPPRDEGCAYQHLLDQLPTHPDNLALAVADLLHSANLDPTCITDLAPRLYDVVTHRGDKP